jgi:hypothetical protein
MACPNHQGKRRCALYSIGFAISPESIRDYCTSDYTQCPKFVEESLRRSVLEQRALSQPKLRPTRILPDQLPFDDPIIRNPPEFI